MEPLPASAYQQWAKASLCALVVSIAVVRNIDREEIMYDVKILMKITALCFFAGAAWAQSGPCTERAIREASAKPGGSPLADDLYYFSPAFTKPIVGKSEEIKAGQSIGSSRANESHEPSRPERIVVAPSGDMAYEYGTHHMSFDDKQTGKHIDFTNAYLRVWKAVNGSCKLAANMSARLADK